MTSNHESPGPGLYSTTDSPMGISKKKDAPSYGFGTEHRDSRSNLHDVPGPGSYEKSSIIGKDGPSLTICGKYANEIETREGRNKPGPGSYDTLY